MLQFKAIPTSALLSTASLDALHAADVPVPYSQASQFQGRWKSLILYVVIRILGQLLLLLLQEGRTWGSVKTRKPP